MEIQLKRILKGLLREHDQTQAHLSRVTKIPPQTIHNWLAGQEPRKLSQLKLVANYFGVTLDDLIFGDNLKDPLNSKE